MSEYPIGSTAKVYYDAKGNEVTLSQLIKLDPEWARNRIIEGERAIFARTSAECETAVKCVSIAREQREFFKKNAGTYSDEAHGAEWVASSIVHHFGLD